MCGIAGIWSHGVAVTEHDVRRMTDRIVHRGPDGEGIHCAGDIGIGMRRLAIIDLDTGWQPIANESGRIHIVLNGEIYNYRELREELIRKGHRFKTQSDTETALHAYEEWGGWEFSKRLRGMFGIAIWDADTRELWLARDRLGQKPLYVWRGEKGIAFASELPSLHASELYSVEVNPTAIFEYLCWGSAELDSSFVNGVQQIRPGCVARVTEGHMEQRPYWEMRFPSSFDDRSEAEWIESVAARLRETVHAHLVSDVPVGAFLSGGLDSSVIVALMAEALGDGVHTFSIGFEERKFNELDAARTVAQRYRTNHHELTVRPDAVALVDQLVAHFGEPFADASALPTWYVAKLAGEHVKVVLTGDGGDESFAGYERYRWARRDARLDRIPQPLRQLGRSMAGWLPSGFPGRYYLDYAAEDARGRYLYDYALFARPVRHRLVRPEFLPSHLGVPDPTSRWHDLLSGSGAADPIAECMFLDTVRYLPMDILPKVDRMTMAHSLESRPPLIDHEFMEFTASIPTALKYASDGTRKQIWRKAVGKLLPEELLDRPKSGFSVPLGAWFAGPLAPMFEQRVLEKARCAEYLEPSVMRELFEENRSGRRDHGIRLWALLMLESWLRTL